MFALLSWLGAALIAKSRVKLGTYGREKLCTQLPFHDMVQVQRVGYQAVTVMEWDYCNATDHVHDACCTISASSAVTKM
jgi:hypothetical protein